MHRSITIVCSPEATATLREALEGNEHVLSLALYEGSGIRPRGDVFAVHVLNRGADEVMQAVERAVAQGGEVAVTTEESASFVHPGSHDQVVDDRDEGLWEEMETGLRHQGRATPNFAVLCACGGAIAAGGLLTGGASQAALLVASSIVAPVYEPVAAIALGIVLRDGAVVRRAAVSTLAGYALLVLSAGGTFALLRAAGGAQAREFLTNPALAQLSEPGARDVAVGFAAAVAGSTMVAALRRSVMAGPLVALAVVTSAAALGMSLSLGRLDRAGLMLQRLGLDLGLIVGAGLLVFAAKRAFVHRRDPVV